MTEIDNNICCLIKFITILDNNGNLLYGKYYSIKEPEKQRELEKKLCLNFKNLNIPLNELDAFNMEEYNVFVKVSGELALFIATDENDNECLAYNFFKIFEYTLSNLLQDNYSRTKFLETYDKIVVMIDEMVDDGIVVNTDTDSLERLSGNKTEAGGGQFISFDNLDSPKTGFFGSFFSGAKSLFG